MAKTARGHIQRLPSWSLRVKVYAGTDPVTGKPRLPLETCPDEASAVEALGRLVRQAEGHQAPERDATFGRVLDRYLEVTELAATTRVTHESYIRRVIRPVLGDVKARKIGPDSLDALNVALRRCSRLCGRLGRVEHHDDGPHACDSRCWPLKDHRTTRRLLDTAIGGSEVVICLAVRRFFCLAEECEKVTFAEQVSGQARAPYLPCRRVAAGGRAGPGRPGRRPADGQAGLRGEPVHALADHPRRPRPR